MLKLDHLTVIAPSLAEGVAHVRCCLGLNVPFGRRHDYMGTHNHLLQLGDGVYLEIVAVDPEAAMPRRSRWFGLDDQKRVREDWNDGRRLRGWVARTDLIDVVMVGHPDVFGAKVALPDADPSFDFTIPEDGSLPHDGAVPSIIDRRGKPRAMAGIADLGLSRSNIRTQRRCKPSIVRFRWIVRLRSGPARNCAIVRRLKHRPA